MKLRLPAHALPALTLSPEEASQLEQEAQAIVADVLAMEKEFFTQGRALNKSEWKAVRSKDDFFIYKQRRARRKTSGPPTSAPKFTDGSGQFSHRALSTTSSASSDGRVEAESTSTTWTTGSFEDDGAGGLVRSAKRLPLLAAAGYVEGTLEDSIYGSLAHDDTSWLVRSSHMNSKLSDSRFLAQVQGPTRKDPFRYLGIKWFTKELPALVGSFVQCRDFLVLEANGFGVDADGNPYGYHVEHSITRPEVPELTELNVIRGHQSLCYISRQASNRNVHLFARGFSDPRGDIMESMASGLMADAIMAVIYLVECSYAKKLAWMMARRRQERMERMERTNAKPLTACELCRKSSGLFSKVKMGLCQICGCSMCSRCTVTKKVVVELANEDATERALPYCYTCVLETSKVSPRKVAVTTLPRSASSTSVSTASRPNAPPQRSTSMDRVSLSMSKGPTRAPPPPPPHASSTRTGHTQGGTRATSKTTAAKAKPGIVLY